MFISALKESSADIFARRKSIDFRLQLLDLPWTWPKTSSNAFFLARALRARASGGSGSEEEKKKKKRKHSDSSLVCTFSCCLEPFQLLHTACLFLIVASMTFALSCKLYTSSDAWPTPPPREVKAGVALLGVTAGEGPSEAGRWPCRLVRRGFPLRVGAWRTYFRRTHIRNDVIFLNRRTICAHTYRSSNSAEMLPFLFFGLV